MKQLIAQIDEFLDKQHHGWCTKEKAHTLAAMVVALRPLVTVEIGVYAGRSAISMAMAHKFIDRGSVIGIDPYSKEAALEGQEGEHREWWGNKVNLDDIMGVFIDNVMHYSLEPHISLVRAKSDDVTPPDIINLAHLDGNHSVQALKDVDRFAPHINIGGIIIVDDISWPGGGVSKAVQRLQELGFCQLYPLDGGMVFQRISHG